MSQLKVRDEKPGEQIVKTDKEQSTIQARIVDKELEKKKMYEEVERLRDLRKQKDSTKSKPVVRKQDSLEAVNKDNITKPKIEEIPLRDNHSASVKPAVHELDNR